MNTVGWEVTNNKYKKDKRSGGQLTTIQVAEVSAALTVYTRLQWQLTSVQNVMIIRRKRKLYIIGSACVYVWNDIQTPSLSKNVLWQRGDLSWIKQQRAPKAEVPYGHKAPSSFDMKGDLAGKWLEPSLCTAGPVSSTGSIFPAAPRKHILAPSPFSVFIPKLSCQLHRSFGLKKIYKNKKKML